MATWEEGYINANGISIHYYRTGGDKPPVVFNHGVMDDGLCWTRVAKELENEYDVIMLDARGHGFSDSGNGDYKSETRAKDVAEVIKALGLKKPVVGGHSLGAEVSIHLAANYPDIPRAIFLEDPPITMPGEPMFGGSIGEMGDGALKMMATVMKSIKVLPLFLGKLIARKMMPVSPDEEIIPWINSKKRFDSDLLSSMIDEADALVPSPFDEVEKVKVPTLLLMGDREKGSIISEEVAEKMKILIPALQVIHLKGANHDIRRSKFDGYMTSVRKFIDEAYQ